ncbi:MAG: GNAT family N-acetyltransferase [Sphingobacteriales bacterium JAD_PAG50586_3]|nr:MAG: GNAT family N-acetyltransferase [Sphingobacteriales bacterium JAD_PAG50586_3]
MISLRAIEPSDLEHIYAWENDPSNWSYSYTYTPFSKDVLKIYIEQAGQDIYTSKQLRLMIDLEENGTIKTIGCVDLFDFEPRHQRAGVGILIGDEADRKNGHASQALKRLISYAFSTLNLNQLFCNIAVDNTASLALFKKHGFAITGTKKQWLHINNNWVDEHTLQLVRS